MTIFFSNYKKMVFFAQLWWNLQYGQLFFHMEIKFMKGGMIVHDYMLNEMYLNAFDAFNHIKNENRLIKNARWNELACKWQRAFLECTCTEPLDAFCLLNIVFMLCGEEFEWICTIVHHFNPTNVQTLKTELCEEMLHFSVS